MASAGGGVVVPKSNGKETKVTTPFKDKLGKTPGRTEGNS